MKNGKRLLAHLEALKQEAKEIADIEATWKMQLEAEEKTAPLEVLRAARDAAHDPHLWNSLTPYERINYNKAVTDANELKETRTAEALKAIQDRTYKAHATVERRNKSFTAFPSSRKAALEEASRAEAEWVKQELEEDEWMRALKWISLTGEERKKTRFTITAAPMEENPLFLYEKALQVERDATKAWDKACSCWIGDEDEWLRAFSKAFNAGRIFSKAAERYMRGLALMQDPKQFHFAWIQESQAIKDGKNFWRAKSLHAQANRLHTIAWKGRENFMDRICSGATLLSWKESINTADAAITAFTQALKAYKQGHSEASEPFKNRWNYSQVEERKKFWEFFKNAEEAFVAAKMDRTKVAWKKARKEIGKLTEALGDYPSIMRSAIGEHIFNRNDVEQELRQYRRQRFRLVSFWLQQIQIAHARETFLQARTAWASALPIMSAYLDNKETLAAPLLAHSEIQAAVDSLEKTTMATDLAIDLISYSHLLEVQEENRAVIEPMMYVMYPFHTSMHLARNINNTVVPKTVNSTKSKIRKLWERVLLPPHLRDEGLIIIPVFYIALVVGVPAAAVDILTLGATDLTGFRGCINEDKNWFIETLEAVKSSALAAIPDGTETFVQFVTKVNEAFQNSFFYLKKIPSAVEAERVVEAVSEAIPLAAQCANTSWEEEATWLVGIIQEIAAFNNEVVARGR